MLNKYCSHAQWAKPAAKHQSFQAHQVCHCTNSHCPLDIIWAIQTLHTYPLCLDTVRQYIRSFPGKGRCPVHPMSDWSASQVATSPALSASSLGTKHKGHQRHADGGCCCIHLSKGVGVLSTLNTVSAYANALPP